MAFTFFGTSLLFVNSHLTPHDGKVKERVNDYQKIVKNLNLHKHLAAKAYSQSKGDVHRKFITVFS